MLWTIQLLGGLAARSPQRAVTRFRTQKAASLLAYLAFHTAPNALPHSRETLIDLLWPQADLETGRHNLSNALSNLRQVLEPPGVPPGTVLLADRAAVRLNPAALTTDVAEFEDALREAETQGLSQTERVALWRQAAQQYQGTLLPGFYEDWIVPQALRLDSLFVQAVGQLVPALLRAGTPEPAVAYARRAVMADPLDEAATRNVMQALVALQQPSQALRAYRQLETRLREAGEEAPSEALQTYARQLRSVAPSAAPAEDAAPPSIRPEALLAEASTVTTTPSEGSRDLPETRPLRGEEFLLRTTTRFFDREAELARLSKMLATPRTRLVTLTGPGGTGKTRLALEVAPHLLQTPEADTPTTAVFVSLAEVADPGRLFEVILRALGGLPASDQDPLEQLSSLLAAHPSTLLILDNFEQLAEEGALCVQSLLAKAAAVKMLVTSRQNLQIAGEQVFHLAPLPTTGGAQTPEELLAVPSIALFVDRAQAVLPTFQLTARNAGAVGQLCDYLEGLPLAIELAAARAGVLSPARILEQVSANRLDFLSSRRRDAASRQRTLRSTLDWSYRLLSQAGQRGLGQLAVFRGGWTLEAAEAVWRSSEARTLERLMQLRDSSLIVVVDTEEGVRFTQLETVRAYGREKLEESGEAVAVQRRHRDFFLKLAEEAEAHLTGPEQAMWLARLEAEQDNSRAALEGCLSAEGDAEAGLRMAGALWRFWELHGDLREGRASLMKALGRDGAAGRTQARAKALNGAGVLAHSLSDYGSARALLEESLAIYRELGDKHGLAFVLNGLGHVIQEQGDYAEARKVHEESLAIRRELGDKEGIALSLYHLGNLARDQGDYTTARDCYTECHALRQELGDRQGVCAARHLLGVVAEQEGDLALARAIYEECLPVWRELRFPGYVAWTLHGIGFIAMRQGDFPAARSLLTESLTMFREMAYLFGQVRSLQRLGGLAVAQGQMERAGRLLAAVASLGAETGVLTEQAAQQEFKRDVAAVRSALGEERFAAAWAEGQAMTMEQAIAYALTLEEAAPMVLR